MKSVSVSFKVGDKMVTLKQEIAPETSAREALSSLLGESEEIGPLGKVTVAQLRALYARAHQAGWDKQKVKELLEKDLGTSLSDEIIGVVDRKRFSRLIDGLGAAEEVPGKATAGQMRALWAKALSKGWERDRVKVFLQTKVGADRDDRIIGVIDKSLVSSVIDEIEGA
ncbi:MAG: hypothetical protein V1789_08045 [PVC group bacterium]